MHEHETPVVLNAADADALDKAAAALAAGEIVGVPTETVYGLAVMPQAEALKALLAAKQRPQEKGVALLVDGLDQVESLVAVPDAARLLATRFWPGPLTLVLPLLRGVVLPEALTGGRDTLGLRLPDHALPRALSRRLGPLAVSSANRSGEPEATTAAALAVALGGSVALVLDDGPVRGGVASSVLAVDAEGTVRTLRQGALEQTLIEAALAEGR